MKQVWLRRLLVCVMVGWLLLPFSWILVHSVRPVLDQRSARVVPFVQFTPTLAHWRTWLTDERLRRAIVDSAIVAAGSTVIAVALGCPAGYGLARFRYRRWSNADILLFFLSQRMLPPIVVVLPFYVLARWSGTFDSRLLLIVVHATFHMPLVVLLLFNQFRGMPEAIEESAAVEGCSIGRFFFAIAIPMAAPTIGAAALISLSFSWNEFLFALLLTSRKVLPLTRLIQSAAENDWGVQLDAVSVIGLIAVVPPAVLGLVAYYFLTRQGAR
jgi:multiple sugar transport system permease protein